MYEGKDPLIWKLDELGPCKAMSNKFDMDNEDLRFKIIAEPGNNNCTDPFSEVLETKR